MRLLSVSMKDSMKDSFNIRIQRSNTHSQILNYSNPNLQIFKTQVIQSIIRALLFYSISSSPSSSSSSSLSSSNSFPPSHFFFPPPTFFHSHAHILHSILAGFLFLAISLPSTLSLANTIRNIASSLVISFF